MAEIVKFILGRAGSGKSKKINEIILNEINLGNEKLIVIVPEQFSFEKEKSMLEFLGNNKFSNVKVMSFSRLCDFIPSVLNIPAVKPSSDTAQILMISEAIESLKADLKMYAKGSVDMKVAELVLKTIKELKSNKIDKEALQKIHDLCSKDILKQKIKEMIAIYDAYKILCKSGEGDSADSLSALEDIIRSSDFFEGYTVFFDGFSNFTAQQFSLIEEIMLQAKEIYMAFCVDEKESMISDYSLFLPSLKTIAKIKKIANKNFISAEEKIILNESVKFENSELKILEENIFRPVKKAFEKTPKNIFLYNALDLSDECEQVARTVRKLVMQGKCRYKDIVILTRDMQAYESVIKSSLRRYLIPFFVDAPEKLFNKNLTNLVLSAFDVIHGGFMPEDVLRYLKTGLTGTTAEEISLLENYVLMWNIKSEGWFKDFSFHPKGYYKNFEEEDEKTLEELNLIRKKVLSPLENFKNNVKNKTGRGISIAVYNLLTEVKAAENLKDFCESLEKNGRHETAEKHAMIWDALMEILNEIASLMSEKKVSSRKYLEILNLALNFANFSYVPQCIDNVTVASAERSLVAGAKIVFLIGAVSGEFPKIPSSSEIFTDQEVNYISALGIELKDTTETFLIKERFLAYGAVTAPASRLFVSWPSADSFGKSKYPSEIVKEIKEIFPNIKVFSKDSFKDEEMIASKASAFEVYAKNKGTVSSLNETLKKFLLSDDDYKEKCETIETFLDENRLNFASSGGALNLFGENLKLSASQIEKYYSCRFAYFCEYGLRAKVRENTTFGSMDYGTMIHFLFEKLFKKYSDDKIISLENKALEDEISELLRNYIEEKLGGFENKPQIFLYTIERLKKSVVFLIKYLSQQLEASEFKVLGAELEISKKGVIKPIEIDLPGGRKVTIEGKIDRADIMSKENENFIRIIDYKTGSKQFKLSDVFYGLNMQMLIYLLTIKENGIKNYKNIIPAGILYFTALKPLIETKSLESEEKIENEIKKKLRMNGLILSDKEVVLGMEKGGKGQFIPASVKDGEVKKTDSVISLSELETVGEHVKTLVKLMCEDLFSGKVSAKPVMFKSNNSSCKFCKYHSICGYEKDSFKKIASMTNEETLEKMKGSETENGK